MDVRLRSRKRCVGLGVRFAAVLALFASSVYAVCGAQCAASWDVHVDTPFVRKGIAALPDTEIASILGFNKSLHRAPADDTPPVFIIGAMKGGTTAMYDCITVHPMALEVRSPVHVSKQWTTHGAIKELMYFSGNNQWNAGYGTYNKYFTDTLSQMPGQTAAGGMFIDASPTYINDFTVAEKIRQTYFAQQDSLKFIAVLRNPAERVLSHWRHALVGHLEQRRVHGHWTHRLVSQPFGTVVNSTIARIRECLRDMDEQRRLAWEKCSVNDHEHVVFNSLLLRSFYDQQLRYYFDSYDHRHFCLVTTEALLGEKENVVERVWDFMGLPRDTEQMQHRDMLLRVKSLVAHHSKKNKVTWEPSEADMELLNKLFFEHENCIYKRAVANGGFLGCMPASTP
eukprot:m.1363320 g.1363320  ORF g.1363320 m.1363320 type:complete len:397 (-) comp24945_c1_seq10:1739-2929(-)